MKSEYLVYGVIIILLALVVFTTSSPFSYVANDNVSVSLVNPLDRSGSLVTLDLAHYQIHEGNHYFISTYKDLTKLVNNDFVITTDGVYSHLLLDISTNFETVITLYEDSNVNFTNCIVMPSVNRNRNSDNNSSLVWYEACDVIDYGNSLGNIKVGQAKSIGGQVRGTNEIILKRNTTYILSFYTTEISTYATGFADWYE